MISFVSSHSTSKITDEWGCEEVEVVCEARESGQLEGEGPKYFHKNIFAKNISGKKIQKYFPICKIFLEKIFPKKLF